MDGYSLVEVLLAAMIMVVGVLGILAVFPQAHGMAKASGRTSVLNHLTSEQLERLRSLDYAHTDLALGIHPVRQTDSNGAGCSIIQASMAGSRLTALENRKI